MARSYVEYNAKFRTFDPPVKIMVGVDEISIPTVEALSTTEPPKCILMGVHCAAAERGGLIKKKRNESSWVKLTAFATNVGRLNNYVRQTDRQTDMYCVERWICRVK